MAARAYVESGSDRVDDEPGGNGDGGCS